MDIQHPLSAEQIDEFWPGSDHAEIRRQFDALMVLCQRKGAQFPRYPEHMADIVVEKSRDLPDRINQLKAALASVPENLKRYVWKADANHVFGDKYVRLASDDGHGMGRQYLAAVPATPRDYFGGLADYMAAANPDTITMLLDVLEHRIPTELLEYEAPALTDADGLLLEVALACNATSDPFGINRKLVRDALR